MKKIGLDAGHGLKTAGKQTPDGIKEWTLNDKVRDKIVKYLKDYDVEIINTDKNEGNVDESLSERTTSYINKKVDVFVSIHHNALNGKWNNATGVEVYVDKKYTSKDMKLAKAIYKNLPKYTRLKGRGIKKENWYVINQNKIPAVLVEGGFMDSKKDYKVITSTKGQEGYAKAVAEGLVEFLGLKKKVKKSESKKTNTTNSKYYPKCVSSQTSIVDALNSIKVNSSFSNRKKIANKNGIKLYIGTANQNNKLLSKLKDGKLLKI